MSLFSRLTNLAIDMVSRFWLLGPLIIIGKKLDILLIVLGLLELLRSFLLIFDLAIYLVDLFPVLSNGSDIVSILECNFFEFCSNILLQISHLLLHLWFFVDFIGPLG